MLNLCVALACVLCAAMAAGLTIGLMVSAYVVRQRLSLLAPHSQNRNARTTIDTVHHHACVQSVDPLELEIKQRVGTAEECRQASVVLPLIQRHHLLLVTLLLYNSAVRTCIACTSKLQSLRRSRLITF